METLVYSWGPDLLFTNCSLSGFRARWNAGKKLQNTACAVLDFTTGTEFRPSLPRAQGPEDEGSGNLGGAILGSYVLTGSI